MLSPKQFGEEYLPPEQSPETYAADRAEQVVRASQRVEGGSMGATTADPKTARFFHPTKVPSGPRTHRQGGRGGSSLDAPTPSRN